MLKSNILDFVSGIFTGAAAIAAVDTHILAALIFIIISIGIDLFPQKEAKKEGFI